MNAGGEPKARVAFGQHARGVGIFTVCANGNTCSHANGFGRVKFFLEAVSKRLIGEVAVGVDHVAKWSTVPPKNDLWRKNMGAMNCSPIKYDLFTN